MYAYVYNVNYNRFVKLVTMYMYCETYVAEGLISSWMKSDSTLSLKPEQLYGFFVLPKGKALFRRSTNIHLRMYMYTVQSGKKEKEGPYASACPSSTIAL